MGRQLITALSREMLVLSMLVKVIGSREDKEDHSFLETLLVVHPPLGMGVQMGMGVPIRRGIKVPSSQS